MTLPAWHEEHIAKKHDRQGFDCGQADLTVFLHDHARQNHERGAAKTFLAVDDGDGKTVYGYYSLSPASVAYTRTPKYCAKALAGMTLEPIAWGGWLFAATYRGRVWVGSCCWQRDADVCAWHRRSAVRSC